MGNPIFTDTDSGYNTLRTSFTASSGRGVFVGFLRSSAVYKDKKSKGMTVATVAGINEFGTKDGTIPARPFMRPAVDRNIGKIERLISRLISGIEKQKFNEIGALRILGAAVQGFMRDMIANGKHKPNKPATIRKKGYGKNPLINTRQMLGSVDFEVTDAKGKSGGVA